MACLLALIKKEITQVLRDPVSLVIMFVLPAFMLVLFGVAVSLDVDQIKLAVSDLDNTSGSREFVRRFTENGYFVATARVNSDREITRLVDSGKTGVGLKIPPGFERAIKSGDPSPVRIVVDGSDNNTASITLSYLQLILQEYSTGRLFEEFGRRGLAREHVGLPVELEPRVWYNPRLVSQNFFVPGLIGLVMMVSTTVLTAMSIVREKEHGTVEMLMVSPISRTVLVAGKIIPYFVIAFINMLVLVFLARTLFGVPFSGSTTLFLALSALFLLAALGLGLMVSTLASSQQVAWTICLLTTVLPSFLLSGFIFPIENMPWAIRVLSRIVPVRYFIVIIRGIMLKGVGTEALLTQVVSLAALACAVLAVSSRRIARRLK